MVQPVQDMQSESGRGSHDPRYAQAQTLRGCYMKVSYSRTIAGPWIMEFALEREDFGPAEVHFPSAVDGEYGSFSVYAIASPKENLIKQIKSLPERLQRDITGGPGLSGRTLYRNKQFRGDSSDGYQGLARHFTYSWETRGRIPKGQTREQALQARADDVVSHAEKQLTKEFVEAAMQKALDEMNAQIATDVRRVNRDAMRASYQSMGTDGHWRGIVEKNDEKIATVTSEIQRLKELLAEQKRLYRELVWDKFEAQAIETQKFLTDAGSDDPEPVELIEHVRSLRNDGKGFHYPSRDVFFENE